MSPINNDYWVLLPESPESSGWQLLRAEVSQESPKNKKNPGKYIKQTWKNGTRAGAERRAARFFAAPGAVGIAANRRAPTQGQGDRGQYGGHSPPRRRLPTNPWAKPANSQKELFFRRRNYNFPDFPRFCSELVGPSWKTSALGNYHPGDSRDSGSSTQ